MRRPSKEQALRRHDLWLRMVREAKAAYHQIVKSDPATYGVKEKYQRSARRRD